MTMETLPASIADPLPAPGNAAWLARVYNSRLTRSITKLCLLSREADAPTQARIQVLVEGLDPAQRLRRSLYTSYFSALDQHRRLGSIDPECLRMLARALEDAPCRERRTIRLRRHGWIQREVIATNEQATGEGPAVRFNEADPEAFARAAGIADEAIAYLAKADVALAEELAVFLSRLYLFEGKSVVGLTSPRFHGTMLISIPSNGDRDEQLGYFMEHVIHELSHMYLNTILSFDRLVENDPSERFDAPIRTDKRPLLGIYHSTFVLVRIVALLDRIASSGRLADALNPIVEDRRVRLAKGIATLDRHARMTELGARLLDSIRACA